MICIVVANQDKWTTVLDGKLIGTSKHIDYSIFHHKAKDVAALKKPITMFIWVGNDDKVSEVIMTSDIKERGQNYKTAKRESTELNPAELTLVVEAIELVRAVPQPKASVPAKAPVNKPVLDFNPGDPDPTEHKLAEGRPMVILSAAGAANGLGDIMGQADELQGEPDLEEQPSEPELEQPEDPHTLDPLATVKPSRTHNKKKRRGS